jgi:hypothetical protein
VNRERVARIAARWTTELAVVFVGVYGAFALAEWEEDREREERAAQIRGALIQEIRGIQEETRNGVFYMGLALSQLDSAMKAGMTPRLQPEMQPIGFRTHVWDATLASGELGLLDVETFYEVSEFYNRLNAGLEQLRQIQELSKTMLLPVLDEPAANLYEAADSAGRVRLRPQYRWYVEGLGRTRAIARCVTVLGDTLLLHLGAAIDTSLPPMPAEGC